MALRGLDISAESTFDFVLPEGCKEWPAPHYGPYSPHTEHPKPGGSLRLRKREATGLAKIGGKKALKVQRQKDRGFSRTQTGANGKGGQSPSSPSSHAHESSLSTHPQPHVPDLEPLDAAPLTLLSLPRELRDLIYSHLVQHPEPLTPQYRPCWKLLPGPNNQRRRSHRVIRRSPPEPPLALVSRQLRHETLAAFYGSGNTFLFQRSAEFLLRLEFNMLDPVWMGRWMRACGRGLLPLVGNGGDEGAGSGGGGGGEEVSFLRNVELRFDDVRGATDTGSRMGTVTFSLSQTAGGGGGGAGISICHDLSTAFPRSCACRADAMVEWITARSRDGDAGFGGLGDVALKVCRWRERDFGVGEGKVRRVRLGQARRGEGTRCERCGKVRVG
ncbi:hypothetical protein KC338_g7712 [Hortaea werneckii]|nr:hypothetical protein KC338_g7712 [Hortaea werneckii]